MTKARGINRGDIWAFRLARDNSFAGNGLVRVAGQNGGIVAQCGCADGETSPAEMKPPLYVELYTKISIPDSLPSVEPWAIPLCTAQGEATD